VACFGKDRKQFLLSAFFVFAFGKDRKKVSLLNTVARYIVNNRVTSAGSAQHLAIAPLTSASTLTSARTDVLELWPTLTTQACPRGRVSGLEFLPTSHRKEF